jgi:hypothetical protein
MNWSDRSMLPAKKIDRLLVANPTIWQGFSGVWTDEKRRIS